MRIPLDILSQGGNQTPPPPIPDAYQAGPLRDAHDRPIRDLRLSLTDRCNFRCVYCLEPGTRFMESDRHLAPDHLLRLVQLFQSLGIDRVRLTGGEPTVRPELDEVIGRLGSLGLRDLSMTTNGLVNPERFQQWRRLGLSRVTFSLDAASPETFEAMTRVRASIRDQVIESIREAARIGLSPVRVNAVIIRGMNEHEILPLVRLTRSLGVEMRFIEFMPLDDASAWDRSHVVSAAEIRETIEQAFPLRPIDRDTPNSTALRFRYADDAPGGVGLIAPVSQPFCGACSRVRVTADGRLRPCLFSRQESDLSRLLRAEAPDDQVVRAIRDAVYAKQAAHNIGTDAFRHASRTMSAIGG